MTTIDNKRARISNKILITINNKKYHWASDRDAYNGINDLGYLKTARTPKKEYLINVILPWFKKNGSLEKRREHQKCKNYFIIKVEFNRTLINSVLLSILKNIFMYK